MIHSTTWRRSTERLTQAREILNHPSMASMLAVLELDHPAKQRVPSKVINDGFGATYRLGQIDGFELCLSMLKQLGEAAPLPPTELKATWGIEEQATGK